MEVFKRILLTGWRGIEFFAAMLFGAIMVMLLVLFVAESGNKIGRNKLLMEGCNIDYSVILKRREQKENTKKIRELKEEINKLTTNN